MNPGGTSKASCARSVSRFEPPFGRPYAAAVPRHAWHQQPRSPSPPSSSSMSAQRSAVAGTRISRGPVSRLMIGRATIGVASRPSRSTSTTTSSPGSSHRPRVCSRTSSRQPPPTVPVPSSSPGRRCTSDDARATIAAIGWWIDAHEVRVVSTTRTPPASGVRTVAVTTRSGAVPPGARRSASSSGVTSHGPMDSAKSLPFANPMRAAASSRWRSRADQSLSTRYPPIASSPRSSGRFTAATSTTAPISAS